MSQGTTVDVTTGAGRDTRLAEYLLGAFGITWALWIPAGLSARNVVELPLPQTALVVVGSFGPMVAALAVAGRHGGWPEAKALLSRLRFRGVAKRWVALALLLGAVTLAPAVAYLAVGGSTDAGTVGAHVVVLPLHFLIVATIGGGLDEEVGWRGMAQPLLQRRLRPVPANVLLGLIWATWHLPLWLDPNSAQSGYHFAVYTLVILGHSLVTGYLYNASGGSLLIAVLTHSSNNTFDGLRYAILGDVGDEPRWQFLLAAVSLGLGLAIAARTRGLLGVTHADRSVPPRPPRLSEQPRTRA